MAAIPTSPLLRETTPFRLSPWALGTQRLVSFRCLASPLATSTPLLALERLILTSRMKIRLLALQRFCLTPPAQKTRRMEQPRLNLTRPVSKTRPTVLLPFLITASAISIPPLVFKLSLAILKAFPTPLSAFRRYKTTSAVSTTLLPGFWHSREILPAISIQQPVLRRCIAIPSATTIPRTVLQHS